MTDTVNKQRLLEWLESELKNKDYESHVLDTLTTTYLRIKSGKFDSPPTTPVQGYREALERVRKINKLPYWSDRAMELEFWQGELESQALSQTDIQPSGWIPVSMEPVPDDGLYIVTDGSTSTYGHWSAGIGTITYWMPLPQPPGINSTEDDQRGPSISSTRFMLDGQLCGVCNEGVPLDH
ncbi:hypothetical protein ACFSR7_35890, partial [Cohnella sp. GCM10020058]|uniref:hypothetical protein n=1 Tax=Cohnella sp. GCM10020058 TaxID=3317330 RepID=UPI003631F42C